MARAVHMNWSSCVDGCVGRGLLSGLKAAHSIWLLKRCIVMTTTRLRSCRSMQTMTSISHTLIHTVLGFFDANNRLVA